MHDPAWAMLDLPTITPILTAIFDSANYIARGGGREPPGATEYQRLHYDIHDRVAFGNETFGAFHDPSGRTSLRDLPCPYVCCNFLMVDFTAINGPTRQILDPEQSYTAAAMGRRTRMDETEYGVSAPAGSVLIRDPCLAWRHTELINEVRAIPTLSLRAWFHKTCRLTTQIVVRTVVCLANHSRYIVVTTMP